MDDELREIESQLEKLSPKGMPSDMVARMMDAMDRWQETVPAEEKIVPFQPDEQERRVSSGRFNVWATAAAVALMGAVGAVMMNPLDSEEDVVATTSPTEASVDFASSAKPSSQLNVVDVSNGAMGRDVAETPSQKIVFDAEGRPHRLVRIEYNDKYSFEGEDGKKVLLEKPAVEYYLVPVQVD